MKHYYTLIFLLLVAFASSQTPATATPAGKADTIKSSGTRRGDRAFNRLHFYRAIKNYSKALAHPAAAEDTLYILQKIADSYRGLNDPAHAAAWYKKLIDTGATNTLNTFWYAGSLLARQQYDSAKQYYLQYCAANPADKNAAEILTGMGNLNELLQDRGIFTIDTMDINSPQSDLAAAFYTDESVFFTSNRTKQKKLQTGAYPNCNYRYQIYLATPDSCSFLVTRIKAGSFKRNGKIHYGPVTYCKADSQLLFTQSRYKKGAFKLKIYSMRYPDTKRTIVPLAFNNAAYSCAHPTLSADGRLIYFSSDKPGGQGGTDLYVSFRDPKGIWSEPHNLGPAVNTAYDEKFPFIAADGTLYFSSDAPYGLGGLDVYKTMPENGVWSKPENLGVPVNSSSDDFALSMDNSNTYGYFTSNRAGGNGEDDIYRFAYDESKLDYKTTLRAVNSLTGQRVSMATLMFDCNTKNADDTLTDNNGEKTILLKGGKPCTVEVSSPRYKNSTVGLSFKNRNDTVNVLLKPDLIKLMISVVEAETGMPVPDAALSLTAGPNSTVNFATDEYGLFELLLPLGKYSLTSQDYNSLKAQFSEADADSATGVVKFKFSLPRAERIINVPLTGNCFSTAILVSDLKTGEKNWVNPNAKGEVRVDLKINSVYLIDHNGKRDTIYTAGLKPGMKIDHICKFFVGQTWLAHNIYYDLDKWSLRPAAGQELDNLVRVMNNYPGLEIELGSYTDCRASEQYNFVLSDERAQLAVDYITKHGIKNKRIKAEGYGEKKIINGCVSGPNGESSCTELEHQANRRTDIKVLKY